MCVHCRPSRKGRPVLFCRASSSHLLGFETEASHEHLANLRRVEQMQPAARCDVGDDALRHPGSTVLGETPSPLASSRLRTRGGIVSGFMPFARCQRARPEKHVRSLGFRSVFPPGASFRNERQITKVRVDTNFSEYSPSFHRLYERQNRQIIVSTRLSARSRESRFGTTFVAQREAPHPPVRCDTNHPIPATRSRFLQRAPKSTLDCPL